VAADLHRHRAVLRKESGHGRAAMICTARAATMSEVAQRKRDVDCGNHVILWADAASVKQGRPLVVV
jgi:hypothetical protein